jgi:hypothetical protein
MTNSERLIIAQESVDAALDVWLGDDSWREQCYSEVMRKRMRRTLDAAIDASILQWRAKGRSAKDK